MKKIILIITLLLPFIVKGISTTAQSAILMDTDNNRIIYSKNIHEVSSVASISKIMTAVLAIESGKLDEEVKINSSINKAYGSAIYIKIGEKMKLRDLIYGLMLRSGNDAALAIADYVGGSVDNFVIMMNHKAKEIGMKNSKFNNPSGLDEDKANYSTAYDMAILTSYAMKISDYRKIVKTKEYKLETNKNTYIWHNKHKLLRLYKYTTGGKTGYTKIAKRTLVTTASKDNTNLVAYINIYNENYYKDYNLYIKEDFKYILDDSEKESINIKYKLKKIKKIKNRENVGSVIVSLGDKQIYSAPIYAKLKTKNKKKWRLW